MQSQKSKRSDTSRLDLLHNGIRRTISRQEYTKIFTKIKIPSNPNSRIQTFFLNSSREQVSAAELQNQRLRQENKRLEAINQQLSAKISKEYKLENILAKKIEKEDLDQLSFEKTLEIKLLLESEELRERLKQKTQEFDRTFKQHKDKEQIVNLRDNSAAVQLYVILFEQKSKMAKVIEEKEDEIDRSQARMEVIKEKILRIREIKKERIEQAASIDRLVERAKANLPNVNKVSNENDSGIFGTQIRAKTTQSLERQIERMHQQNINYQHKLQQLTEKKIKEKIQILKDINQYQNLIISHGTTLRRDEEKGNNF